MNNLPNLSGKQSCQKNKNIQAADMSISARAIFLYNYTTAGVSYGHLNAHFKMHKSKRSEL
jgi:hypothetical protein